MHLQDLESYEMEQGGFFECFCRFIRSFCSCIQLFACRNTFCTKQELYI